MLKFEVYGIFENTDKTEGRGASIFTGITFRYNVDALNYVKSPEYAKDFGVMGFPGTESDVRPMTIYLVEDATRDIKALSAIGKERAIAKVLAKLTNEERALLGYD